MRFVAMKCAYDFAWPMRVVESDNIFLALLPNVWVPNRAVKRATPTPV
jgi:hypothetical protein